MLKNSFVVFVFFFCGTVAAEKYAGFRYIGEFNKTTGVGAMSFTTSNLYWLSDSVVTWGTALSNCNLFLQGSTLLTINSEAEDNAVRDLMLSSPVLTAWSAGAYDTGSERYRWVTTGAYVPTGSWIQWAVGSPSNVENHRLYIENDGLLDTSVWHSADVGTSLRYICEKEGVPDPVTTSQPYSTTTPPTTVNIPFKCVLAGSFPSSTDCRSYYNCVEIGGVLYQYNNVCPAGSHYDPTSRKCVLGNC